MTTRIKLSELVEAFDWVSATGPFTNAAYIDRATGRIWLISDFDDAGEEAPDEVEDESLYLPVPEKDELDLGRHLALRFAEEQLPESYDRVRAFFGSPGAYRRFKDFLDGAGHLDSWFAFEAQGVEEALRAWAADNDIEISEGDGS